MQEIEPEKPQPHYNVRSKELPEGVCSSDSESVAESEVESKSCEEVEPLPPKKAKVGLTIKNKYKQKYRKAWEKKPSFKGWLKPVNHKPDKAYCTACSKELHSSCSDSIEETPEYCIPQRESKHSS